MRYKIAGADLNCSHCFFGGFECSSVQLNTAFMTLIDLDWLNKSATVFQCQNCGKLEWFGGNAEVTELDDLTETDCLACDGTILAGKSKCNKCGWGYADELHE